MSLRIDLAFLLRDCNGDIAAAQRRIDRFLAKHAKVPFWEEERTKTLRDIEKRVAVLVPLAIRRLKNEKVPKENLCGSRKCRNPGRVPSGPRGSKRRRSQR